MFRKKSKFHVVGARESSLLRYWYLLVLSSKCYYHITHVAALLVGCFNPSVTSPSVKTPCSVDAMNWTGGRLRLHSKTTVAKSLKNRKQRFARANLQLNDDEVQHGSLSPFIALSGSAKRQKNTTFPFLQSSSSADIMPFEIADAKLDCVTTKFNDPYHTDFQDGDSIDQIKTMLLSKADWLGLSARRPSVPFLPTPKIERIGRRRRFNENQKSHNYNRCSFENKLQSSVLEGKQQAPLTPQLDIHRTKARAGSEARLVDGRIPLSLHYRPQSYAPSKSSSDSMLLRASQTFSDQGVKIEYKLDDKPATYLSNKDAGTASEGLATPNSSLLPLNQVKELETFDAVKERSQKQSTTSGLKKKWLIMCNDDLRFYRPDNGASTKNSNAGISWFEGDGEPPIDLKWQASIEEGKPHFTIDDQAQVEYDISREAHHDNILPKQTTSVTKADDGEDQILGCGRFLPKRDATLPVHAVRTMAAERSRMEQTVATAFGSNNKTMQADAPEFCQKQSSEPGQDPQPERFAILLKYKAADNQSDLDAQVFTAPMNSPLMQAHDQRNPGISVATRRAVKNEKTKRVGNLELNFVEIRDTFRFGMNSSSRRKVESDVDFVSGLDQAYPPSHVVQRPLVDEGQPLNECISHTRNHGIKRKADAPFSQHPLPITPKLVHKALQTSVLAFTPSASKDSLYHSGACNSSSRENGIDWHVSPSKDYPFTNRGAVVDHQEQRRLNTSPEYIKVPASLNSTELFLNHDQNLQSPRSKPISSSEKWQRQELPEDDGRCIRPKLFRSGRDSSWQFTFKADELYQKKILSPIADNAFVPATSFAFTKPSSLSS